MRRADLTYASLSAAAVLIACTTAAGPVQGAERSPCREVQRRYELIKSEITSVQLNSVLFQAADRGCELLARALLAAGAAVEARDRLGRMPLSYAARSGHLALVDLLLENGAPINARNLAGSTALYLAAENDRLAVMQRLLAKGADPNLSGRGGVTPIAAAAFMGNDRIVEVLLAQGVDPNGIDKTGKAPIVYAASLGFTPVVRRLLDAGVDVNARYGNDLTVLMWAAGYAENAGAIDAEAVVNLLVDRGAAIDAVDNRGRSALMTAAELGHGGIVDVLLARGADRTLKDKNGKSALELADDAVIREKLAAKQ